MTISEDFKRGAKLALLVSSASRYTRINRGDPGLFVQVMTEYYETSGVEKATPEEAIMLFEIVDEIGAHLEKVLKIVEEEEQK